MKTSKLKLRPFIAGMQIETGDKEFDDNQRKMLIEQKADKREPFATLTFGNVTIELDYTIFRNLELKVGHVYDRVRAIFNLGKEEILQEMNMAIDGREEVDENTWFRDNPKKCSITNINSPLRLEEDNWRSIVDGRRNMEWERMEAKKRKETEPERHHIDDVPFNYSDTRELLKSFGVKYLDEIQGYRDHKDFYAIETSDYLYFISKKNFEDLEEVMKANNVPFWNMTIMIQDNEQ